MWRLLLALSEMIDAIIRRVSFSAYAPGTTIIVCFEVRDDGQYNTGRMKEKEIGRERERVRDDFDREGYNIVHANSSET